MLNFMNQNILTPELLESTIEHFIFRNRVKLLNFEQFFKINVFIVWTLAILANKIGLI